MPISFCVFSCSFDWLGKGVFYISGSVVFDFSSKGYAWEVFFVKYHNGGVYMGNFLGVGSSVGYRVCLCFGFTGGGLVLFGLFLGVRTFGTFHMWLSKRLGIH